MSQYYQEGALLAADFSYNMLVSITISSKGRLSVSTVYADADTQAIAQGWRDVMQQKGLETPCIINGMPFTAPQIQLDPKRHHLATMHKVFLSITPERIQRYPMVCLLAAIACHDLEGVKWSIRCGAAYTLLNGDNTCDTSADIATYLSKYGVTLQPNTLKQRKLSLKASSDYLSDPPHRLVAGQLKCGNMALRYISLNLPRDAFITFLEQCTRTAPHDVINGVIIPALRDGITIKKCSVATVMWSLCVDIELVASFTIVRNACQYYVNTWSAQSSVDLIVGPRCGSSYNVDAQSWLPSIKEIAYDPHTHPHMLPYYGN